jgi:predicted small lipoprotein YifL
MRRIILLVVVLLISCGSIAACGQKGPLYLPGPDAPQEPKKD